MGFFEPIRIVGIHDELLATAGSSWHDTSPLPEAWFGSPTARAFVQRLRAAYVEEFGDADLTVLKDPRVCRFLPLWQEVLVSLDVTPLFVIPFRNPVEVASSLAQRDGFSSRKSQILWLQHVLLAEQASRGWSRGFLSYEGMLVDPRRALARLSEDFAIEWPCPVEKMFPPVEEFLSRRHHHNRAFSPGGPGPEGLAGLVADTYATLEKLVGHPSLDQEETFNQIRASYLRSDQLQGALVRSLDADLSRATQEFEARKTELSQSVVDRDSKIRSLVEEARVQELKSEVHLRDALASIAERDGQIENLTRVAADRQKQLGETRAIIADREKQIADARVAIADRDTQIENARAIIADRERQIAEARATIADRNTQITTANQSAAGRESEFQAALATIADRDRAVAAADEKLRQRSCESAALAERALDMEERLRGTTQTISDLRASTSWWITSPLRALRRLTSKTASEL